MPLHCAIPLIPKDQEAFHAVDRVVMRHAFDAHNAVGRFFDEEIYQAELARRCLASDFEVHREVQLRASYLDFSKPYYIDMLVGRGVIYDCGTYCADCLQTGGHFWTRICTARRCCTFWEARKTASKPRTSL